MATPCYAARNLLRAGYCVQPLQPNSKKCVPRWRQASVKFPTMKAVRSWWQYTVDCEYRNVGILTGELSGGLAVRDFDGQGGGQLFQQWREQWPELADSLPIVKTPGGYHVYCRLAFEPFTAKDQKHTPQGELVCGGLVTAPPSRTPKGKYEWLRQPVTLVGELAQLTPEQLMLPAGYGLLHNVPQTPQTLQTSHRRRNILACADLLTLADRHRTIQRQTRDLKTWELACALRRASIAEGTDFEFERVREVAIRWAELSRQFLIEDDDPSTFDVAAHVAEIWRKYKLAKTGGGNFVLAVAANWTPPATPHENLAYCDERLTHLLDFLATLTRSNGSNEVFASQRDLAQAIGICNDDSDDKTREKASKKVYRWLEVLAAEGLITIPDRGDARARKAKTICVL